MSPLFIDVTQQAVVNGVVLGLVYAILAAGFVLIYRSTGVLNFAQGEIGAFGVAIFTLLAAGYDVPYWIAFALAIVSAALVGLVVETTVVRRLSSASKLVMLIATIGVSQLLVVARVSLPDRGASKAFPLPFDLSWQVGDGVLLVSRDLLILIVAPLTILALAGFLTRTRWGLMVRASAGNPDTARVFGISVKKTSTIVWMIAAAFAGVTAILIAPVQGITPGSIVASGAAALGPGLMVRALIVALIARLSSLPMTLVGGLIVGVAESVARANVDSRNGAIVDVWLLVAAIVLVLFWVRGRSGDTTFALSVKLQTIPERLRSVWYVRHVNLFGFVLLFGLLAAVPVVFGSPSQTVAWTDVLVFAMMALPLSMLTGWAGQFTLGQFAFVGLGAGVMVMTTHGTAFPFFPEFGLALGWWQAAALATAVGGVAALVIGVSALRVKGLFLAVITLAFAVASSTWIFRQAWFTGSEFESRTPYMEGPSLGGLELTEGRPFYFLCLAVLAVLAVVLVRIRRSGIGRAMIAVSDNEEMAAAATVSPTRMKLIAFGIAGAMASLAGCFFVTLRVQIAPSSTFSPDGSVLLVSTAIIGGIGTVAGPVIGALFTRGLPALFGDVEEVQLLTSGIGLLVLLMYFPGGLMQIVHGIRGLIFGAAERKVQAAARAPVTVVDRPIPERHRPVPDAPTGPWLAVKDLSVRFGGNQAVDKVSFDVGPGELVGLIGTNGAGKSTVMNAISGFVPSTGTIEVLGHDISRMAPYRRHCVGLGRGFQAARLYPNLTVRETVMVALEARERTDLLTAVIGIPPAPGRERRKRSETADLIGFLGLDRYADEFTANLSTGTRRIVELACLLAAEAKVLMLDEPTGGVAQKETEAFGPLLKRIQQELGASMVVIEHDMPLVMSISDRLYCLEAGKVIASGAPDEIRNNPAVIASYLGTDERAIQRSGASSDQPVLST